MINRHKSTLDRQGGVGWGSSQKPSTARSIQKRSGKSGDAAGKVLTATWCRRRASGRRYDCRARHASRCFLQLRPLLNNMRLPPPK